MDDAWVLPALPVAAFVVLLLVSQYLPRKGDYIAIGAMAAAFVLALVIAADMADAIGEPATSSGVSAQLGVARASPGYIEIRMGTFVDQITLVMLVVVTFVALLVMIYSTGYMHGDRRYGWFYAIISLFVASMLALVLADNLLLLYFAWELVGLCSMLLIGYYNDKQSAAEAAKKAFITTRVGDVGLLIGIIILFTQTGTFNIQEILHLAEEGEIQRRMADRRRRLHLRRRRRQVGAVPAARLAARRHGGPDARLRADPRRDDGRRRRLPRRAHAAAVRGRATACRS